MLPYSFFRAPEAGMSFTSGSHTGHSDGGGRIEPDFAELFPPHRFSAASVCSDGDTVLWSGITRRRFEGYPLEAFAPLRASPDAPAGAWHAYLRQGGVRRRRVACPYVGRHRCSASRRGTLAQLSLRPMRAE